MRRKIAKLPGVLAAVFFLLPSVSIAQSPDNVAVVVNDNSPESRRIADHYARTRGLPATHVLRVRTVTEESIDRAAYLQTIEAPLASAIRRANLQDRILYIVLTRGIPLRIAGTAGLKGTTGSVDSELTLLYRRMTGQRVPIAGHIENPYFLGGRAIDDAKPFTHREHDIYLVTRLDAFTADEATALIDRAQHPRPDGVIVLDQRVASAGPQSGDEWMARTAEQLRQHGHGARVVLESTPARASTEQAVLGFYSWGSGDPENRVRTRGLPFTAGSIAASLASFDARSFRQPPDTWHPSASPDESTWFEGASDTLIADLIREGVTGVAGQVGEAFVLGAVRPDILFPAYMAGFNLAEAFYLATPALSWQQVLVGDPLAAPFDRQRLTRQDLEEAADPATLLPKLFAERRLANARSVSPGESEAVVAAAIRTETLLLQGEPSAAREGLVAALEITPSSAPLLLMLADLEEKASDYDAAIKRYRRVLEVQPTNVVALNNLAYALAVRKKQPEEGLPFARKAASLAPRLGTVIDTHSWIEHLLGNHDAAVGLIDAAVKLDPTNAEIRLHAAVVKAAAGDEMASQLELEHALKLDPTLAARPELQRLRK